MDEKLLKNILLATISIFLLPTFALAQTSVPVLVGDGSSLTITTPGTTTTKTLAAKSKYAFNVNDYGANCDGTIIYSGATITSGSPTVSTPGYTFTSADIGKTITLSQSLTNSHYSGVLNSFTSTIASVSSGNAVMSANSTFSYTYANIRMYKTDNYNAITAAITAANAVNGGEIVFPAGVCATHGPITFYSNDRFTGASNGSSIIMLTANSNSDLFLGYNFAALTGTNNTGGVKDFAFEDLQLDGNRGANTGTSGSATSVGAGIRVYGYEFTAKNMLINWFAGDGMYSEWSNTAGNPIDSTNQQSPDGMEANLHDIKFGYNAGWGQIFEGPHDSRESYLSFIGNGVGGLYQTGNGSPLTLDHVHGYQEGTYDIDLGGPYSACHECYSEGSTLLEGYQYYLTDSNFNNLVLGNATAEYSNYVVNTVINNLNANNAGGFNDRYANVTIGAISGTYASSYTPNYAVNTTGLTYNNYLGSSFNSTNGASYPYISNITSSSCHTFTLAGIIEADNGLGQIQHGSFATNCSFNTGVGFDLSYYTSTLSQLGLPKDSTANRPTGFVGGLRYNTTTNLPEIYNGNWLSLAPITPSTTPADNATCTAGQLWTDSSYIYVCTASGTVKRAALGAF